MSTAWRDRRPSTMSLPSVRRADRTVAHTVSSSRPNAHAAHPAQLSFSRSHSRVRSGAPRLVGFGMSVVILAAASLVAIPAMIGASGEAAWGAIALGQYIGTVGAVAVGYGWGWFGPARIAQYNATDRRVEYLESLTTRVVLLLAVSPAAAALAYVLASSAPWFAALSALSMTSMGLSANWYFVGLSKPFAMLALDTMPRAAGTAAAVVLMYMGHSAIMGPLGMLGGMLAALCLCTMWILRETGRGGAEPRDRRSVGTVLVLNRHGIASALGSSAYLAAPVAIVSVVAPGIQPAFALADRVKGLIVVASTPAVTVLQGWVPRVTGAARVQRANTALVSAGVCAVVLGGGTIIVAPSLVNWLGHGQISLSWEVIVLMSCCVSVALFQAVLERVALATFELLRAAVKAVAVGSIVGLPLVGIGAHQLGTAGALGGILAGLLVSVSIELFAYVTVVMEGRTADVVAVRTC
jgi:O-antigen/teichoic acid export membrane protein